MEQLVCLKIEPAGRFQNAMMELDGFESWESLGVSFFKNSISNRSFLGTVYLISLILAETSGLSVFSNNDKFVIAFSK